MRFQVPQFIETETKLVGPFTLKQFLWIAGGVVMTVLASMLLSGFLRIGAIFLIVAFFGSLAFVKIDGMPLVNFLAYMLSYGIGAKQYLFRRTEEQGTVNIPGSPNAS